LRRVQAPAKVNLRLKITGRREDGYHLLSGFFTTTNFNDELEISEEPRSKSSDDIEIHWSPDVPRSRQLDIPQSENLVIKAIQRFRSLKKIPSLKIIIHKKIPPGAGLGGGSSNATAALKTLVALFGDTTPSAKDWSVQLGADIPFFFEKGPQLVEGIGEKLTSIKIPKLHLLLWIPDFGVPTKEAYCWYDDLKSFSSKGLTENCLNVKQSPNRGRGALPLENFQWSLDLMENDLELPVAKHFPQILQMKKELADAGSQRALMTGSGSTVFGVFRNKEEALAAEKSFRSKYGGLHTFFVCHTTAE
jgi:4-diphosphocytidyl-2-C-methyl-D-erythritol kinase